MSSSSSSRYRARSRDRSRSPRRDDRRRSSWRDGGPSDGSGGHHGDSSTMHPDRRHYLQGDRVHGGRDRGYGDRGRDRSYGDRESRFGDRRPDDHMRDHYSSDARPPFRGGGGGGRFVDAESRRRERESRPLPEGIWTVMDDDGGGDGKRGKARDLDEFGRTKPRTGSESGSDSGASGSDSEDSNSSSASGSDSSSSSDSESSSDSDDRRSRRRSSEKKRRSSRSKKSSFSKRKQKSKKKKGKRSKRSRSSRSSSSSSSSSSDSSSSSGSDSDTEMQVTRTTAIDSQKATLQSARDGDLWEGSRNALDEESDEEDIVGPRPPPRETQLDARSYGKALLPGEGEAIGAFVAAGQRIPRRGEVGMSSDQIESFEKSGYVMSGSRHKRMNAIRIRKENQVYSAEEQRALSLMNLEEAAARERELQVQFRRLVQKTKEERGLE